MAELVNQYVYFCMGSLMSMYILMIVYSHIVFFLHKISLPSINTLEGSIQMEINQEQCTYRDEILLPWTIIWNFSSKIIPKSITLLPT